MRTTIDEVRRRFDDLLMQHAGTVEQFDCVLCEDGTTAMFYAHLSDGDALAVSLDLSPDAASSFDGERYAAMLDSRCDRWAH